MLVLQLFAMSVLLPAVFSGSLLYLGLRLGWGDSRASALALGLAIYLSYGLALGFPPWPPIEATQRLVVCGPLLVIPVALMRMLGRNGPWAWSVPAVLVALFFLALFQPSIEYSWKGSDAALWIGGTTMLSILFWMHSSWAAQAEQAWLALAAVVFMGMLAVALAATGSALLGQVAGVVAAALGGFTLLALRVSPTEIAQRIIPSFAFFAASLIAIGHLYSELPAASAAVFFATPVLWTLVGKRVGGAFAASGSVVGLSVRLGIWLLPALAAMGIALWSGRMVQQPQPYY